MSDFEELMSQAGTMHIEEFERIVWKLSNSSHCRYWIRFTKREDGQCIFVIQCLDAQGRPIRTPDLLSAGFVESPFSGLDDPIRRHFYLINRVDENGNPFK